MKPPFFIILILVVFTPIATIFAQIPATNTNREVGRRLIQYYAAADYNGIEQNFEIEQDSRGIIYVGNGSGLLEYDGARWRAYRTPKRSAIVGLAIDDADRLFVGGPGEMGYFGLDSTGQRTYYSLVSVLPDSLQTFSYVGAIDVAGNSVFYRSPNHIFQLDLATLSLQKVWFAPGKFYHNLAGEDLIMWREGIDWGKISGDSLISFAGGLEDWNIFPLYSQYPPSSDNSDSLLVMAESGEAFIFNGKQLTPFPLGEKVNQLLKQRFIWNIFPIGSKGYLLRRDLKDGFFIDHKGIGGDPITEASGFVNTRFSDAFMDQDQKVWLATDDGISKMDAFSPVSLFGSSEGLDGSVQAIARHKGILYVGTSTGLFMLEPSDIISQLPRFQKIDVPGSYWSLLSTEDYLLAGGEAGIQLIKGDQKIATLSYPGIQTFIYSIYPSPFIEGVLYVGHRQGVFVYKKKGNTYQLIGSLSNIETICRTIIETAPGKLWIGTQSEGLLQFELPESSRTIIANGQAQEKISGTLTVFDESRGIPPSFVNAYQVANQTVITTRKGLRKYNPATDQFVPESAFGNYLADTSLFVYRIAENQNGEISTLDVSNDPARPEAKSMVSTLIPDEKGNYQHQYGEPNLLPDGYITSMQVMYADPDQPHIVWMGGTKGLVRYDLSLDKPLADDFPVYLRSIKTIPGDSIIYHGNRLPESQLQLTFDDNSLRFEFAAAFFQSERATRYQFKLSGEPEEWSKWSKETYVDFTNLSEGTYQFQIRAKNIADQISESVPFTFIILPPWYRSWWAYVLYGLFGMSIIMLLAYSYNRYRMRKILKKNMELETIVEMRTEEIQDKNQQLESTLSHLKTTQDQLIMQEKMASLGSLTVGIAHEIKNPLNFVHNFALSSAELSEELEEEIKPHLGVLPEGTSEAVVDLIKDIARHIDLIQKQGSRANDIVVSMMNHANDNAGEKQEIDINSLLTEQSNLALHGYKTQNERVEINITNELTPDLPLLNVNPQEIGRVIINMMNNAFHAVEQKAKSSTNFYIPSILLKTEKTEKGIEIRIRDNGDGISKEIQSQIFQPFFTTKPTGEGNIGLGLSISYDIITKGHQGQLKVDSEEGKYTEFCIILPTH